MDRLSRNRRLPVHMEAELLHDKKEFAAIVGNISETGLYILPLSASETSEILKAPGIKLQLRIPSGEKLRLSCKLKWTQHPVSDLWPKGIGLEIIDAPPEYGKFYRQKCHDVSNSMSRNAIAIVGMACRYPGARNLKELWENILSQRRQFRRIPNKRFPLSEYYDPDPSAEDKTYATRAAVIDGFEFDWVKHGIPKPVVESSDITHWLALETALNAIQDAGFSVGKLPTERSGVILGNTLTGDHSRSETMRLRWPFVRKALIAASQKKGLPPGLIDDLSITMEEYYKSVFSRVTEDTLAGSLSNTIAGRICNYLNFNGGGYTVDGACSSSLIAVATAASKLSSFDLDLAIAGGIDISLDTFELIGFAKTNALTYDDMRVYDRRASGFIPGEGTGFVVMKRLEDAYADRDYVYAVLCGWGVSSDGKGAITAPKAENQALAIRRAYAQAGYTVNDVDFIEGHGTGTPTGDRAELEGIALAMDAKSEKPLRFCGISSLKSLLGHTKAASGIGGFIKAVMAVNRRILPPTAACKEPNEVFDKVAKNVYPIMRGDIRGPEDTVRAGISGMGFGGINCHVTIESGDLPAEQLEPSLAEREIMASSHDTELFVLSAENSHGLLDRIKELKNEAEYISIGEMVDLSKHLAHSVSRNHNLRASLIASSPDTLIESILNLEQMVRDRTILRAGDLRISDDKYVWLGNSVKKHRVGFLFPGQGSQLLNMGRILVDRYPWAREVVGHADELLKQDGIDDLIDIMYPPVERALNHDQVKHWYKALSSSEIAQPAICLTSLLWIQYLDRLGIRPTVAGGHSLGELSAFHMAGAFDEKTFLRLAAIRGRAMAADENDSGVMAVFGCSPQALEKLLEQVDGYAVVANINSPTQTVLSGERRAVEKIVHKAAGTGISSKMLPVSNAFHSRFVKKASNIIRNVTVIPERLNKTNVSLYSCMDRASVSAGMNLRNHFADQIVSRVDFITLINNMKRHCDLFVEVGPSQVLSGLFKANSDNENMFCFPIEPNIGDDKALNTFLGASFVHGVNIQWTSLFENRLVRPFIAPSQRIFIENPCEKPFSTELDASSDSLEFSSPSPTFEEKVASIDITRSFTNEEMDLLRNFIKKETKEVHTASNIIDDEPISQSIERVHRSDDNSGTDSRKLLELASDMTGFPVDSLNLELKLLDDLNLDSIKSAQFVSKAIKLYDAEGKLDPTSMANSTLAEIFNRITGDVPLEPPPVLPPMRKTEPQKVETSQPIPDTPWVRNFKITYERSDLSASESGHEILDRISENGKRVLIVSDNPDDRLPQGINDVLSEKNFHSHIVAFSDIETESISSFTGNAYVIFVLPHQTEDGNFSRRRATRMADRMFRIGSFITSLKSRNHHPSYAAVQFGSGNIYSMKGTMSPIFKGSTAFLASLHLENPQEFIKVLEFHPDSKVSDLTYRIFEEFNSNQTFAIAGYDEAFKRSIPVIESSKPQSYKKRNIQWSHDDVILVTGGARGITAECSLAFSKKTGVKLAIMGRTVIVENDEEIQSVFKKLRDNDITYRYYACDIASEQCVLDVTKRIENDLGTITGVIHGAAVNHPERFEQISFKNATREISPKLFGAINILKTLEDKPQKLIAGFSSIIGITGMPGNTWYGFSNEVMNLLLQHYRAIHKNTEVISFAFSIWSEVGMGAKLGSVDKLSAMGISPIPPGEGIKRFLNLIENDPGEDQIIVSSKLGNIDTFTRNNNDKPDSARYLEEIILYEKDVEIKSKATLTLEKDPYLKDHAFNGTFLLPAVFGIEAMAQAVFHVIGIENADSVELNDIKLSYPITVDKDDETEIHIHALVKDSTEDDSTIIEAAISVNHTNFEKNHYQATFVLKPKTEEKYDGTIPTTALDIIPEEDLYGDMLFHGKRFQRIDLIRSINNDQAIFVAHIDYEVSLADASFDKLYMGDPFFRDTLLQSIQLSLPDIVALPTGLDRWEISLDRRKKKENSTVIVSISERGGDFVTADVIAIDNAGKIIERVTGYRIKIMKKIEKAPSVKDLIDPDGWDGRHINEFLGYYSDKLQHTAPIASIKHQSDFHKIDKNKRHKVEQKLFAGLYDEVRHNHEELPEHVTFNWNGEGKPIIEETAGAGLSCSHDNRVCLCVAGMGSQGCDIEPITQRREGEWRDILGKQREGLLKQVSQSEGSLDVAGTRIWCALEALRKASDMKESEMVVYERIEDCLVFKGGSFLILTFSISLLRGPERIVAFAVSIPAGDDQVDVSKEEFMESDNELKIVSSPGNSYGERKYFSYQFPLSLRDNATVGGGIYFTNYFHWLGRLRELVLNPIRKKITDEFSSGHYMATNHTDTHIVGDVRNHEKIDSRFHIADISGNGDSTLNMHFEWRRLLPDGSYVPIAFSEQQVSWIRISESGSVEPVGCPSFFKQFLDENNYLPDKANIDNMNNWKDSIPDIGKLILKGNPLSDNSILHANTFDTNMENSNLAQNIYFSNYFSWQGNLRDRYFFTLDPKLYKAMSKDGQLACLKSNVTHLREAMPFDSITIIMKLRELRERGIELYFEYFKSDENGDNVKLAYGDHTLAWVRVDKDGKYIPQKFPDSWASEIMQEIEDNAWTV